MGGKELLDDNFPAIYQVGAASLHEPRLLSLTWGNQNNPRVTLVGKGVCFDSGGLNLKTAAYMRYMKKDMGGAAQVIGLAQWIMTKKLPIRLQILIPAVEISVASASYRPGDILTMRNGTTVEIHNTDAEGRLILADSLVKACEEKPELIIDFATLTGAARAAMGTDISAMFTHDETIAHEIYKASQLTNDPICRLPLYMDYIDMIKSNVADLSNASDSPYAGTITAALFLDHFVDKAIPGFILILWRGILRQNRANRWGERQWLSKPTLIICKINTVNLGELSTHPIILLEFIFPVYGINSCTNPSDEFLIEMN